jgi:hypothetical protein
MRGFVLCDIITRVFVRGLLLCDFRIADNFGLLYDFRVVDFLALLLDFL